MSYDYDEDEQQNDGPPALREHAKKLERELKETKAKLEAEIQARTEAEKKAKAATLRDVLTDLKIDPKFARLAERDGVEPEASAVKAWVDENKDFYSFTPAKAAEAADEEEQEVESEDEVDPTYRNAVEAANRAGQQGAGMGSTSVIDQINDIDGETYEDMVAKIIALGAPR